MGMCASDDSNNDFPSKSSKPNPIKPVSKTWFPESVPTLKNAAREDVFQMYNMGKMLGTGKFGQVREVTLKSNSQLKYAIKTVVIDDIKDELFRLETELNILKKMDHCNIIKFYETYTDGKRFHIVMELCNGGELFDTLIEKVKFTEDETLILMRQILSTIAYLHKQNYCHRDLKPENFLFKSTDPHSQLKLIDFGLASKVSSQKALMSTIAGSPYYVAPEVLEGSYTFSCDIWSAGIIMYILLCGKTPVDGENSEIILDNVKNKKFVIDEQIWNGISPEGRELFRKMTNLNPLKRPTAENCLVDPWFTKIKMHINPKEAINNMVNSFNLINPLKSALFTLLPRFIDEAEKSKVITIFQGIDESGYGLLPLEFLKTHLKANGIAEEQCVEMIKQADFDQSGFLTFGGFLCLTIDTKSTTFKDALISLFKYLDSMNKGMVSLSQLMTAFKREANMVSPNDVKQLWKALGKEENGFLDIQEFIKLFM